MSTTNCSSPRGPTKPGHLPRWRRHCERGATLLFTALPVLAADLRVRRGAPRLTDPGWCFIDVGVLVDNYQRLEAAEPRERRPRTPRRRFVFRGRVEPCWPADASPAAPGSEAATGDPCVAFRRLSQEGRVLYCDDFRQSLYVVGDGGVALLPQHHVELWDPRWRVRDHTQAALHRGDEVTIYGRGYWVTIDEKYPRPLPADLARSELLFFQATESEPIVIVQDPDPRELSAPESAEPGRPSSRSRDEPNEEVRDG